MLQDRCPYCGRWFKPIPGKGTRQKTCLARDCQRKHKRALDRRWRADDPGWRKDRQNKARKWAKGRGYWEEYRAEHPKYVERNRKQTLERMRRRREDERKVRAVLGDPVGYLRGLKVRCGADVCKTGTRGARVSTGGGVTADDVCKTGIGRDPIVDVVEYLITREMFAKQEGPDSSGGPMLECRG